MKDEKKASASKNGPLGALLPKINSFLHNPFQHNASSTQIHPWVAPHPAVPQIDLKANNVITQGQEGQKVDVPLIRGQLPDQAILVADLGSSRQPSLSSQSNGSRSIRESAVARASKQEGPSVYNCNVLHDWAT
jgi:hypothetical protein